LSAIVVRYHPGPSLAPTACVNNSDKIRANDSRLAHERWRTWLPLGAVVAAVFALVALPLLRAVQVRPLNEEMRLLTEPSRALLTRIHVALALEQSLVRNFIEGGDSVSIVRYRKVVEDERRAYAEIAPLIRQLGPTVRRDFDQLLELEKAWHREVDKLLSQPASQRSTRDPERARLYEDILLTAAALDEGLNAEAATRRAAIEATNRAQVWITFAVGGIALATAFLIAWIGRRLRLFAVSEEDARRRLEEAAESRARLIRGITHDLRNPLQSITGSADLLAEEVSGTLTASQREVVQRIQRSARHLVSMVSDLLQLAMAEGGTLTVRPAPTRIADLLRHLIKSFAADAASKEMELTLDLESEEIEIVTDAQRVTQVLQNLVSNALKYTPRGGRITVAAGLRKPAGAADSSPFLAIDVADTGHGIPDDQIATIFDEFTRMESHKGLPGSGLGLAIASRVAGLLGGKLTVSSSPSGSVFTLWLPQG
jgi:signal transduction histidine kinase